MLSKVKELAGDEIFIWGEQIAIYPGKYRKMGVGTKMLETLYSTMKKDNIKKMFAMVAMHPDTNIAGISFCKKNGFDFISFIIDKNNMRWCLMKHEFE